MGWEEEDNIQPVTHTNLWAGWFPSKVQNDIPGNLFDPSQPIGFRDCNNVVYRLGQLQKMFGYDNVNSSALESGAVVTSLFYSPVLDDFVGTVNDALYTGMDGATPTDISGTATITAGVQVDITEWQFETNSYIIGLQQGNPPWTWPGSGTASALGGSPPQGRWIKAWQNAVWIANTSTEPSTIFFSNLGDPTTWTTNDDYKFDAPITGLGILGSLLVVFMEDHIGILSGTNNRVLTKVDRYINSTGCTGGFTIRNCFLNGEEVLIFHGKDGFYAFNGSRQLIKLSNAISNKYQTNTAASRWNEGRFANAWSAYISKENWYVVGLSDASDTQNGFLLIFDLNRFYELPNKQGMGVPIWPVSDQAEEINCIVAAKSSSGVEGIYFGSDDGFVYLYNTGTFNRNSTGYTGYATSKIFDPKQTLILLEANIEGTDEGSAGEIEESINFDLVSGLGQANTQNMTTSADVLDTTFILDTSILDDQDFIFRNFAISNWGRFFQFDVRNEQLNQRMDIHALNFVFKALGVMPNQN